jgi:hypothetical protein
LDDRAWDGVLGPGPLVAVALHNGHRLREDLTAIVELDEETRLREEDPYTGEWTAIAPTRLVAQRSRFAFDLNRPRDTAIYRRPEDAWGHKLWKGELPEESARRSLAEYDAFYAELGTILREKQRGHGRFVVLDLHSYNHMREGPDGPPADPEANPQVNVGTGSMDRERWGRLVDRFIADLHGFAFPGGRLDVRENVKFRGRRLAAFVHETFPESGCALAVEVKKFFMDEWTARRDERLFRSVEDALRSTVPGLLAELGGP